MSCNEKKKKKEEEKVGAEEFGLALGGRGGGCLFPFIRWWERGGVAGS